MRGHRGRIWLAEGRVILQKALRVANALAISGIRLVINARGNARNKFYERRIRLAIVGVFPLPAVLF
jgi:hypothetical protein